MKETCATCRHDCFNIQSIISVGASSEFQIKITTCVPWTSSSLYIFLSLCMCVCEQEFWKFVLLPYACMHALVSFRGDCVVSSYHTAACNIISSFFTEKNWGKQTPKQDILDGVDSQYSINVQRPTGIESNRRMPPKGRWGLCMCTAATHDDFHHKNEFSPCFRLFCT